MKTRSVSSKIKMSNHPMLSESKKATKSAIAWGRKEAKRIKDQDECRKELVLMVKNMRAKQKLEGSMR